MFVNPSSSILKQMNNCVTTNPASTDFCMIMLAPPSSVFSFDQIDESSALEISSHNTSHTKNERQPLPYTVWGIEYVVKHELFELVNMVAFGMIVLGPSSPVFSSNQIGKSSAIEMLSHNTSCTKNNQQPLL